MGKTTMAGDMPILLVYLNRSPGGLSRMASRDLVLARMPVVDGQQMDQAELDKQRQPDGNQ